MARGLILVLPFYSNTSDKSPRAPSRLEGAAQRHENILYNRDSGSEEAETLGCDGEGGAMHNHLHPEVREDESGSLSSAAILVGLLGMILSISADFVQIDEMYPHYVENYRVKHPRASRDWAAGVSEIPLSLWLQWLGDLSLCYYGVSTRDVIITLYGALNTSVIVLTIFSIQKQTLQGKAAHDMV